MNKLNFLSINDLSHDQILALLHKAEAIEKNPHEYFGKAQNKILGLLFFEPSTRTYFSFASAINRLGGNYLGFADTKATSMTKGETLEDTARMMAAYADILVVRHAELGSIERIARVIDIPLINAGEGVGEHPTQALTDLFTIYKKLGRLDVTIALCGDLKFGRTNHSLLLAGAKVGANFICIAPPELQIPNTYLEQAKILGANITLASEIAPYYDQIDVLYVSRLQTERLSSELDLEQLKSQFLVNPALLQRLKKDTIIMHPLPRVGEIDPEIDSNPRAVYFEQAKNAVAVRMAIILCCLSL